MPSLRFTSGPLSQSGRLRLVKPVTTLGREADNDIVIPHPSVDAHHAYIAFDGRRYTLSQASRKNDLWVNGRREKSLVLTHQDNVRLGELEFAFAAFEDAPDESAKTGGALLDSYRKLGSFTEKLLGTGGIEELLNALLDAVIEVSGAERGFLILKNEGQELERRVVRRIGQEDLSSGAADLSDSIIGRVLATRGAVIVSDALNDESFRHAQSVVNLKLASVMCAPLIARGNFLGLIYLGNNSVVNLFTQESLKVLEIFAAQGALLIQNALLLNEMKLEQRELKTRLEERRFGLMVGSSDAMQDIFRKIERVAPIDIPVLIQGETGTGKELVARSLHDHSGRKSGPFIVINCGAIPRELLESEFFGHVRGAFTGAIATRMGKFKAADGGTLFLDEIGDMPLELQVKLLRVLEERKIVPVGDTRPQDVDIRVVAASNKQLDQAVRNGGFREDLFYRLNVITLQLPALRERTGDVALIAKYFLARYAREYDRKVKGFSARALDALTRHNWPGNVRELENRLRKAVVMCEKGLIEPEDLELDPDAAWTIKPLAVAREEFQKRYVLEALRRNGGNRTRTAQMLDVDPRTIFRYLEKIEDDE